MLIYHQSKLEVSCQKGTGRHKERFAESARGRSSPDSHAFLIERGPRRSSHWPLTKHGGHAMVSLAAERPVELLLDVLRCRMLLVSL